MTGRIVIGVDGSEQSVDACRWALSEGRLRGERVEAVLVWRRPQDYGELIAHPVDDAELIRSATDRLATAVAGAGDGHPGVDVTRVVLEGDPARVLCERADGADLLVVGAHHHHRLASALLGSIGARVERHCPCPLVVVPHRTPPGADRP